MQTRLLRTRALFWKVAFHPQHFNRAPLSLFWFLRTRHRDILILLLFKSRKMTINKITALKENPTLMEAKHSIFHQIGKESEPCAGVTPHPSARELITLQTLRASFKEQESSLHRTLLLASKPHRCVSQSQAEVHIHTLITLAVSFKELYVFPYHMVLIWLT